MSSLLQIQRFSSSSNLMLMNRTNGKPRYQRHFVAVSKEQRWTELEN